MKQYALILNPISGRGKGKRLAESIKGKLEAVFPGLVYFETEYPGHAREIAARIKNDFEVIIAGGGDGTVHETVNGMIGGSATLAVIPIGSGNDFVKMLSLPKDPEQAIEVIRQNHRRKIDLGKMNDTIFPNGLGIGFDAWVVRESMKVKRLRGILIYLYAVLKTVFSYPNQTVTFSANGKTETKRIFLIAVGNGRAMGGGFFLTPEARIDDALFDVCIIHALKKREVFWHLPKVFWGGHVKIHQVQMLRTASLKIESGPGIAAHADGELLGMNLNTLNISILPTALKVIYKPSDEES